MAAEWKKVAKNIERVRVPGGWVVADYTDDLRSICFVPDPRLQFQPTHRMIDEVCGEAEVFDAK